MRFVQICEISRRQATELYFDTPSFSFLSVLTAFLFHIFAHTEQCLCKQEIEEKEEVMNG